MHSDKKKSKEDTWRPVELRKHVREDGSGGDEARRRDDKERKHRGEESIERLRREPEKESRKERDKQGEREHIRERRDDGGKERNTKQSKEDSNDRRERRHERDNDKERRKERDRLVEGNKYSDDHRENKDRKRDRDDKHDGERDKERYRDKEKDTLKDRERRNGEDRDKRKDERDKERRREERDREHRSEREKRRHEESRERVNDRVVEKDDRERRERHRERERAKDEREEKRNDKERRERHGDTKHSEQKEKMEHKDEHRRRQKEERERRHKERGHDDQKQKPDSESRQHRHSKRSGEEEKRHGGDRERTEREKHKERRHREEEDGEAQEKKHRDGRKREEEVRERSTAKKSDSHRSRQHEPETAKTELSGPEVQTVSEHCVTRVKDAADTEEPVVNDEDYADQEYEDDFEDYEEDFEEMDESDDEGEDEKGARFPRAGEEKEEPTTTQKRKEMEDIQRAMNEENERVGTTQSRQSTARGEEDGPKWSRGSEKEQSGASPRGRFIDFVAAKQREVSRKVATKQKKRSTELLRLIDLDFSVTASLLDLPPVNEYDMYIRTFGTANTKQAYVQCNEDSADRDVQTEEVEICEKWTQHPPEHGGACGDPNLSQATREKNLNDMNVDSQRLSAFLRSASQVMVVLLEEEQAERTSLRKLRTQTDTLSFSDGSLQLNTNLPFLYGRHISQVHFSPVQQHTVMSVHAPTTKPSAVRLDGCAIVCIWNIWEPSRPQKILVYESEVQCCCFSPGKATLVFAGTAVGSVVLWDLREPAGTHYRLKIGEDEWTFRQPTFSTDAVMSGSGHFSPVSSVEVVPSTAAGGVGPEVPSLASEEESGSGLSFQLASLDEFGLLNFWVVVELPKADEAGSCTDLGLRPGGKVKLLHSSSLPTARRASPRDAVKTTGPFQTLHLKFLPSDSNHFFIGTNMGVVSHGTSHGVKALPKFYRFLEDGLRPVDVSSIHFSPFRPNLFLVGCGDGCVRLHAVGHEQPVAEWRYSTAGEAVVSVQWAQTRPAVFCVLDAASGLHVWDLLKNDTQPVITERMTADRVTSMAVFGDSAKQNTYSGIALVHESGRIEMHYFTRDLTVATPAEEEKLESMRTDAL